jgi:hypothetical protein
LRAFDEKLVAHGSDFDLNAPLKSTQMAQEAAKSTVAQRRQTGGSGGGIARMPARAGSAMGQRTATLAAPGVPGGLRRENSFNALNNPGRN